MPDVKPVEALGTAKLSPCQPDKEVGIFDDTASVDSDTRGWALGRSVYWVGLGSCGRGDSRRGQYWCSDKLFQHVKSQ